MSVQAPGGKFGTAHLRGYVVEFHSVYDPGITLEGGLDEYLRDPYGSQAKSGEPTCPIFLHGATEEEVSAALMGGGLDQAADSDFMTVVLDARACRCLARLCIDSIPNLDGWNDIKQHRTRGEYGLMQLSPHVIEIIPEEVREHLLLEVGRYLFRRIAAKEGVT